ncbi:phosphotransferase [Membranihabitans marinus]|uniref:phosphotransferase n=1 Tax=Membranihabitans marinus TaxID=1227546 RepID=UPI001F1C7231|nr:phosphotransferase [Membranihabitans marinus]
MIYTHLTINNSEIQNYLQSQSWLQDGETVDVVEVPGEGNMNFTARVVTSIRTFIIKQSRPYVEKYPQVPAPEDRIQSEATFYQLVQTDEVLSSQTPSILESDVENNVLLLEDLGAASDFTHLYKAGTKIDKIDLTAIVSFIARLHQQFKVDHSPLVIHNREMRKLNHEHIFHYPFIMDNGLDLDNITPGLAEVAMNYKTDTALKSKIEELGQRYLADGDTLLHGDYFPGSWLKTNSGIYIIDPEFCFFGFPEFEVGVLLAHLMMADQNQATIDAAIKLYQTEAPLDVDLCLACAGVEVMRRLLGLAQLPLNLDLNRKTQLLKQAYQYINLK